ncbi:ABC transporter permease [Shinella sp.]|uniref:ABC transporter permease n=1 Tax=Shinella sp. TaxID=1870904 RepID=UPI0029A4816C|nr:ABC transporter permease [Shinella sp.]MDX3973507.1 ABC transporter permease [Shinella sp.]
MSDVVAEDRQVPGMMMHSGNRDAAGRETVGSGRARLARRANRRAAFKAALPAMPLLVFLACFLLLPLLFIFHTAISDREIADNLPRTVEALGGWDGQGEAPTQAYAVFAGEVREAEQRGTLRALGRRVGYQLDRGMSVLQKAARVARSENTADAGAVKQALIDADPAYGGPGLWTIVRDHANPYSTFYLRWAAGFETKIDKDGLASREVGYDFRQFYLRTIFISLVVTALTLVVGYPLAFVISTSRGWIGGLMLFCILLPFWTSLLVRTMSWIVVLQTNGVLNGVLSSIGAVSEPATWLYTRTATILVMFQIQLPFTVLPMLGVMQAIPPSHVRAARSLGAGPIRAHFNVFFPQAIPGMAAGGLLTFVLCLGFYLTPALVGGASDQMISFFIARFTNEELNWGLASALSTLLVVGAGICAMPFARLISRHSSERK